MATHYLAVLLLHSNSKIVYDHIYLLLYFNQLQCLIVKHIMNHIIKIKEKMYLDSGQKMLIYIRGKSGIGKSRVIKAFEIGFALLSRRRELGISTLTGLTTKVIGGSKVHTVISITSWGGKNHQIKVNLV